MSMSPHYKAMLSQLFAKHANPSNKSSSRKKKEVIVFNLRKMPPKKCKMKEEAEEDDEEEDDEEDEDDSDYEEEEEEEEEDSSNSSESYETCSESEESDDEEEEDDEDSSDSSDKSSDSDDEGGETPATIELKQKLMELLAQNPKDKTIQSYLKIYKEKHEKYQKRLTAKNVKRFKKQLNYKNPTNELKAFKQLSSAKQTDMIAELTKINAITCTEMPYRLSIIQSSIPVEIKSLALQKLDKINQLEKGTEHTGKMKHWIDGFMHIPFEKTVQLPVSMSDGIEKCHEFMENAKKIMDDAVFGMNDAKLQFMQYLGQLIANPSATGTAIAIHGPPGTGKTSLVKEGISKILNRPFEFIALGGATDGSYLDGLVYTYEGSTWGKIVQILMNSKCMNPVIYFDELDKLSTARGNDIMNILTHLTDTSQNTQFQDKYFSEISLDLSKCLFIFSYNDESAISPILRDRMYQIKTVGYSSKEKCTIANQYIIPRICKQVNFQQGDIVFPPAVVSYIAETYCNKEKGIRDLKRCLEIIHTKLNLYRLTKPNSNMFQMDASIRVTFPVTLTTELVRKMLPMKDDDMSYLSIYM